MAFPPSIRLTYFDLAARAEAIRTMFRLGGVAFEDKRVSRDEFVTLKPTLPYGTVPVLEVDDELIAETRALQRYAARLAGLYPIDDPLAVAMVEEVLATFSEIRETRISASRREQDPEKKKVILEDAANNYLPRILKQLDARLGTFCQYPFFRDSQSIYVHEIMVAELVDTLKSGGFDIIPANITEEYKTITATHAKVANYLASGKVSTPPDLSAATPARLPKKIKLSYPDVPARGEFIRLALHIGGISFEDERISRDEMRARKPSLPYGQVPVLDVDGVVIAQSFALVRYAAILSGLYPIQEPLRAARMDEIIARVEEFYNEFQFSFETQDMDERRRLREQLVAAGAMPKLLSTLEKRVAHWKGESNFIFGDQLTIADLVVYHLIDFLKSGDFDFVPVTVADDFPILLSVREAVLAHPRVLDWYASRPVKA